MNRTKKPAIFVCLFLLVLLVIFGVRYVTIVRPEQRQQEAERRRLQAEHEREMAEIRSLNPKGEVDALFQKLDDSFVEMIMEPDVISKDRFAKPQPSKWTDANYVRLTKGILDSDAKAILGDPTHSGGKRYLNEEYYVWKGKDKIIKATFKEDEDHAWVLVWKKQYDLRR